MLKNGGGSIVNTASMAAMVAFPNMAAYCAAKGGVKQLTKTAAVEYASKGIRANAICPGTINTAITAALPPAYIKAIIDANPVKRIAEPVEVAHLAVFLASDESSFITAPRSPSTWVHGPLSPRTGDPPPGSAASATRKSP